MGMKIRIGELLVQEDVISCEQLEHALQEQRKRGRRLGRTLIDLGYIEEDRLLNFIARQLDIPFVDLRRIPKLARETVQMLPETHARRFRALVLEDTGRDFLVGMADPIDIFALDELSRILGRPVRQAVVREADLMSIVDRLYGRSDEISSLAEELHADLGMDAELADPSDVSAEATQAPVMRLLRSIFESAVRARASDIHLEPDERMLRVRQRVDGVLNEQVMKEARIGPALVLRLKLMAGLDISEKRLPQDGSFEIEVGEKCIDVRLATLPVQHGESVVLRLLDKSGDSLSLDQLGMPRSILERMRQLIHAPHGLILVTGPTGSGKTTTLYAALQELNTPEQKIITVEDPVEYRLPRVNQVQVHPQIGLTFARVLRAALRQDPDIVMVGEMRDSETAEIGLRAAMTGHLVLSTLHTNDAISSGSRLIDMGAQGYLVASSLRAVVAQRLVRKVCEQCAQPYLPGPEERVWLQSVVGALPEPAGFRRGTGCSVCNSSGYRGRIGVYELLEIRADLLDPIRRNDQAEYARRAQRSPGFRPLTLCALDYAMQGVTTLAEVLRVGEERIAENEPDDAAVPEIEPIPVEPRADV